MLNQLLKKLPVGIRGHKFTNIPIIRAFSGYKPLLFLNKLIIFSKRYPKKLIKIANPIIPISDKACI